MVIASTGDELTLEQIRKQLGKIVTVVKVRDLSEQSIVERRPAADQGPFAAGKNGGTAADHRGLPRQHRGCRATIGGDSVDRHRGQDRGLCRAVQALWNQASFADRRDRGAQGDSVRGSRARSLASPSANAQGQGRRPGAGSLAAELSSFDRTGDPCRCCAGPVPERGRPGTFCLGHSQLRMHS